MTLSFSALFVNMQVLYVLPLPWIICGLLRLGAYITHEHGVQDLGLVVQARRSPQEKRRLDNGRLPRFSLPQYACFSV